MKQSNTRHLAKNLIMTTTFMSSFPDIKRNLIHRTGRNVTPAAISILYWGTQRGHGRDSEQSPYAARDREIFPASA